MEPLEYKDPVKLPNSTAILIIGIASIPLCCCFNGLLGLALSITALILANKALGVYAADPSAYTPGSLSNVKAGRICAIIGLVFSLILLLIVIWFIAQFGWDAINDPEELQRLIEQYQ